jgi:pre-rRNA-processing protein TSR3
MIFSLSLLGPGHNRIYYNNARQLSCSMNSSYPPTIVVRNPRENPRKCSILPLKGRADLLFVAYPARHPLPLENYIRLSDEGPELGPDDRAKGLLLLDGSWRWAGIMGRDFLDVPPRSLHGYATAYPRRSKRGTDPDNGLASVEALFLAYYLLGRTTVGLLDHYRWADEFLRLNRLEDRSGKR